MKILYVFYFLVILFSCKSENRFKDSSIINKTTTRITVDDFPIQEDIKGNIIDIDLATEFDRIMIIDTLLLLSTSNKHKEFLKVYSLNTYNFLGNIGVRGEAPGEYQYTDVNFVLEKIDNNYYVWVNDMFKGFLKKINITESLLSNSIYPVYDQEIDVNASVFPYKRIYFADNKLFADIGYEDDTYSRFKTMDLNTKEIKTLPFFPTLKNNYKSLPSPILYNFYSTDLRKHPTKDIFVSPMLIQNRIDLVDINLKVYKSIVDGENWQDDYWDADLVKPVDFVMDNIREGYYSTCVSEDIFFTEWKYQYMLDEPPLTSSSKFKVFDWEGNPIALLNLDCNAFSSAYDRNKKILYVIDKTNEQILRYDLSSVL